MERARERGAAGVRLVQAAFHNRSMSLYAKLGFEVREPLSTMQGPPMGLSIEGCAVRKASESDLSACKELCMGVHGFDRGTELANAINAGAATVVEHHGRITGYSTGLAFFAHSVAESNLDLKALIAAAPEFGGPGILVPTRNSELYRWCLNHGLRVVTPMTLMTTGLYSHPTGAYLPSVLF
jgi:hypothetical protein